MKTLFCQSAVQIVQVVAISRNRAIGKDNQLLWHIPEDLQHFKRLTDGGVIVMGRKTFESLGRVLPNRSHHVITRQSDFCHAGVVVAASLDEALRQAVDDAISRNQQKIFIIGGGEIYQQSLPIAHVLEITEVDIEVAGDAYYPDIDDKFFIKTYQSDTKTDKKSGLNYRFTTWCRRSEVA
ncbi:dihydrofolate reductase [Moraxella cuniculi]|uniref:Dihydrofolate reductase n=1 Tax=Moraxella cuniculi TaxID=34061 RepID=A0A448GZ88_9GAMM|nr:dihydrofolate reductase [Moraxella cuniculi]VEG13998.1 Dihydrofolate reductase [Moraxella cuniculi]